jgi:cold-inducible RNA-binding protein
MNLFVGNLNPETTAASLRKLFSEFGEIVSFKVIIDNATGMSRGFGFVEMADKFHAYDAIDNLDSIFFEGNIISVKEAKQNNTKDARGGSSFGSKPGFSKPGFNKPGFNRPGADRPASDRPSFNRPASDRPSFDRPGFNKPAYKPRTYTPTPRPETNDDDDKFNRL